MLLLISQGLLGQARIAGRTPAAADRPDLQQLLGEEEALVGLRSFSERNFCSLEVLVLQL